MCGSVWYTVTVTEGGMLIINFNTSLTDYNVTGLTNNTSYHVTVTASNNAGSSSTTSISIRTNSNGKSTRPMHMYACMYIMKSLLLYVINIIWFLFITHFIPCTNQFANYVKHIRPMEPLMYKYNPLL